MNTYIISDTHFNHANIIKYCHRPFKSIKEMNETIIKNWNSIVKSDDIIYHLGDFILGSEWDLKNMVARLNGKIYLIRGNHDKLRTKSFEKAGIKILKNAPILLEDYKIALTHRPLPDTMLKKGYVNVHGHIHEKKLEKIYDTKLFSIERHINVSCDVIGFKPILITDLINKSIERN